MYFSNFSKKLFGLLFILIFITLLSPRELFAQPTPLPSPVGGVNIVNDPGVRINTGASAGSNAGTAAATAGSQISNGTSAINSIWEKYLKNKMNPAAWAAAKRIVTGLTVETVNWINSGFDENPGYLKDPAQFFLNQADNGITDFISSDPGLSSLCTPFKAEVKLALVKNHLSEAQPGSCSLTKIKNNFQGFMQDFSQGGWNGWFEMTQNDQNNPYGAYLQARDRLSIKIGNNAKKYEKQIDLGQGILSFEKCKAGSKLTQEMIDNFVGPVQDVGTAQDDTAQDGVIQSGPYKGYRIGDCINNDKETLTPGTLINSSLKKVLGSGIDQLNLADSIGEVIGSLSKQLYKKIISESGLSGAGSKNSINDDKPLPPEPTTPIIILVGRPILNVQKGLRFDDPGAVGIDGNDGDISEYIRVSGVVDTTTEGQYTLTYNLTNSQGTTADTVTRIVNVLVDASAPGAICNAVTDGRGNDEEPPPSIDPRNISFTQSDVSNWKQTATITSVNVVDPKININYKPTGWTPISIGNRLTEDTLGSAWILIWRNQPMEEINLKPESVIEIKNMLTSLRDQQDVIEQFISRLVEAYNNNAITKDETITVRVLDSENINNYKSVQIPIQSVKTILDQLWLNFNYSTTTIYSNKLVKFSPNGVLENAVAQIETLNKLLNDYGNKEASLYYSSQESWWRESIENTIVLRDEYKNRNKDDNYVRGVYIDMVGDKTSNGLLRKVSEKTTALIARMNDAIYISEQLAQGKTVRGKWKAIPFTYIKTKDPNQFDVDLLFCASPDFTPTKGDMYGFMISTPVNNNNPLNKKEKSDIKTFTWGDVTRTPPPQIPIPPRLPPSTQTEPTQEPICTQKGTDEKNYILPILNGGTAPDQAVSMLNQQFNLGYGESAVFYPDSNTIGLPEFYAAGPTPTRPVSPQTGQPWDIVVRCRTI